MRSLFMAAAVAATMVIAPAITAKVPQTIIHSSKKATFARIEGNVSVRHSDKGYAKAFYENGSHLFRTDLIDSITVVNSDIPRIIINTPDQPDLRQLVEKDRYLNATVAIEGNGYADDMEPLQLTIKGRGNSTWGMPKKPMRLKFSKKTSLLGLAKAKNFVLLANYIDPSQMHNALAMKLAQLLGVKYANHMIPCNVTFNGHDLGCFTLSEKVGINSGSVDIDETRGMLFEISTEYDEAYKFRSAHYNLPVMVKDPDLKEICEENPDLGTPEELLARWQEDFNKAESRIAAGHVEEVFDLESLANYLLLYELCTNNELSHPKSCYIHKENIGDTDRYVAGPAWDFDAAFNAYAKTANGLDFMPPYALPAKADFFLKIMENENFRAIYKERVKEFRDNLYPQFMEYFDELAKLVHISAKANGTIWEGGENYGWVYVVNSFDATKHAADLRKWIADHVDYLCRHYLGE